MAQKPNRKGQETKLGRRKAELLDPGQVVQGRDMWQAANAAARIELRPGITSNYRAYQRYGRDQRRDIKGLQRLSNQTSRQMQGIYNFTDRQLAAGQAQAQLNGQAMVGGIADANTGEQNRLDAVQGSTLGGQINSLAQQKIGTGHSASQDALSAAAAQQQAMTAGTNAGWDKFAATQAAGMNDQAQQIRSSTQSQGAQSKAAIRSSLASRMADTRTQYGEARRDAAGKIADLKALFGPTRLKNIMQLRDSERSFVNERAAINSDAANNAADRALSYAELGEKTRSNQADEANAAKKTKQDGKGGGSGSDGTGNDDAKLGPAEYRQYAAALRSYLDGGKVAPGKWNLAMKDLSKEEGVNWSPVERQLFKRRARKSGKF